MTGDASHLALTGVILIFHYSNKLWDDSTKNGDGAIVCQELTHLHPCFEHRSLPWALGHEPLSLDYQVLKACERAITIKLP